MINFNTQATQQALDELEASVLEAESAQELRSLNWVICDHVNQIKAIQEAVSAKNDGMIDFCAGLQADFDDLVYELRRLAEHASNLADDFESEAA